MTSANVLRFTQSHAMIIEKIIFNLIKIIFNLFNYWDEKWFISYVFSTIFDY